MRMRGILIVLVLLLTVTAAAAQDKSDLAGRAGKWMNEYNGENLGTVADLYTKDGCRMPPNTETLEGRDAILAALREGKQQGLASVKLVVTSAESSGNMGWGRGTYELLDADGGTVDKGKWMNVSMKSGKDWLIQCDIWNSDMPLPDAGAAAEDPPAADADAGDSGE